MVYLLYDLALLLSSLVLVPYYLIRGLRYGKSRHGIRERLGYFRSDQLARLKGRQVIWIHAVSVGETRAAIPLLRGLRNKYPEACLVLSNVTETGRAVARDIPEIDLCLFFPFDLSWAVRRTLRLINPSIILIVETEIWPNFVRIAHESKIPVMLVNGRFSDRSFPRYFTIKRLLKPLLQTFSSFCMQTAQDARRARRIGAPVGRVVVTGNLKFDIVSSVQTLPQPEDVRAKFHLPVDVPVWVAGSTHAGEETIVAEVAKQLESDKVAQILVLVPRHPERARSIGEDLSEMGIQWVLRSEISDYGKMLQPGDVLLVDTIGEMLHFYSIADLVFVGGSLVPVGGHNLLEASLLNKPVLFGSYMQNFKVIAGFVLESQAGMQVKDGRQLKEKVKLLLKTPELCHDMGSRGFDLLSEHAGATEKTLEEIARHWGMKGG
ncbi:MAG: 3-deoxy-D-manno-octulosonic acid transferase [Desulfuromonadales bacterium]|nr:3-deoxy-D-manno-octulosonic acid transferase [Desulfuromonadales bacterium]